MSPKKRIRTLKTQAEKAVLALRCLAALSASCPAAGGRSWDASLGLLGWGFLRLFEVQKHQRI